MLRINSCLGPTYASLCHHALMLDRFDKYLEHMNNLT